MEKPNVIIVFADQWRAQATGYAGDPNVKTPILDQFKANAIYCNNAYSGCPVCSPYRASLITGKRPLEHGIFLNDVQLRNNNDSIAHAFKNGGYNTAYIGKWHLNGNGRHGYIQPEFRQGFEYWKVLECSHEYNQSPYYDNNNPTKKMWEGYDAYSQTVDAACYIKTHQKDNPFFMVLSWGPPHNPYSTAPDKFKKMYNKDELILPENVPNEFSEVARKELAGYYAHCSALDECFGLLLDAIKNKGIENNTIVLFTSDHGDMLHSHGLTRKQKPYAESVYVPFLLRYPDAFGITGRNCGGFIDAPDIMPTLLELAGLDIPQSVSGKSFARHFYGAKDPSAGTGLIACYHPFGEYQRSKGGVEYRGVITQDFTYTKTLQGPWLLFDNKNDKYQETNLINDPEYKNIQAKLEEQLHNMLANQDDRFCPGEEYTDKWGYQLDETGTVPYYY